MGSELAALREKSNVAAVFPKLFPPLGINDAAVAASVMGMALLLVMMPLSSCCCVSTGGACAAAAPLVIVGADRNEASFAGSVGGLLGAPNEKSAAAVFSLLIPQRSGFTGNEASMRCKEFFSMSGFC